MYTPKKGGASRQDALNSPESMVIAFEQALEPSKNAELAESIGVSPEKTASRWARRFDGEELQTYLTDGWRFRVREAPYNPRTIVNQVSKSHFVDMVGAAIHHMESSLEAEQANGEWTIIAYEIREHETRRARRAGNDKSNFVRKAAGIEEPQETMLTHYEEEQFLLRVVWVDLARRPELDNWQLRTGRGDGIMADGAIPPRLREEYRDARATIERFQRWLDGEELDPYKETLLDERQTEEALALLEDKVSYASLSRVYKKPKRALMAYLKPLRGEAADAEEGASLG